MRTLTWLRPAPIDNPPAGVLAHAVPGHVPQSPLLADEATRCGVLSENLPAGLFVQDWRCPYSASNTCQNCVRGLIEDEADWEHYLAARGPQQKSSAYQIWEAHIESHRCDCNGGWGYCEDAVRLYSDIPEDEQEPPLGQVAPMPELGIR